MTFLSVLYFNYSANIKKSVSKILYEQSRLNNAEIKITTDLKQTP